MNAVRTAAEPYWDLVQQSLEEAAFFWKRWEADLESLTRNLDEVGSWTEERLHGALDGVRVAGERVVEATEAALRGKDPAAQTAAAQVLAAGTPERARGALAGAVREARGAPLQALVRGIETASLDGTFAPVTAALAGGGPEHSAALCRIKAFRRVAPGREASDALESNLPQPQAQAWATDGISASHAAAIRARALLILHPFIIDCLLLALLMAACWDRAGNWQCGKLSRWGLISPPGATAAGRRQAPRWWRTWR